MRGGVAGVIDSCLPIEEAGLAAAAAAAFALGSLRAARIPCAGGQA